jgi:hypothetical protein
MRRLATGVVLRQVVMVHAPMLGRSQDVLGPAG